MLALLHESASTFRLLPGHRSLSVVTPLAGLDSERTLPRLDLRTLILIRLGDDAAKDRFVEAWAPLADREASRYARSGGPYEDLQAEGMLALWEAALQFDPQRHKTSPERYVHNHLHRRVRTAYREAMGYDRPAEVPLALVPNTAGGEGDFAGVEHRIDLEAAAERLEPGEQETFAQYRRLAAAGAGPDEAARTLSRSGDVGFAAWKKRIERVRKKVRDHLRDVPSRQK